MRCTFPTPKKTGKLSSHLKADICYFPEDNQWKGMCLACPWHGWPTYYTIRSQKQMLKPHIKDSFWKIHLSNCSWLGILQRPLRGKCVRRCKWDWPPHFLMEKESVSSRKPRLTFDVFCSSPASTLFVVCRPQLLPKRPGQTTNYQVVGPFWQTQRGFVLVGQHHLFHSS